MQGDKISVDVDISGVEASVIDVVVREKQRRMFQVAAARVCGAICGDCDAGLARNAMSPLCDRHSKMYHDVTGLTRPPVGVV